MGYDGKGQVRVRDRAELAAAWAAPAAGALRAGKNAAAAAGVLGHRGARRRRRVRASAGAAQPAPRRHFGGDRGVCGQPASRTGCSARVSAAASPLHSGLDYVGVLCVEFFVLDASQPDAPGLGALVVNEMAPRPHNSGHYSMDACDVSQFELQVRTMAGLPLVQPRQHSPCHHAESAGRSSGPAKAPQRAGPPWAQVLALPGTHLHLYGKVEASQGPQDGPPHPDRRHASAGPRTRRCRPRACWALA